MAPPLTIGGGGGGGGVKREGGEGDGVGHPQLKVQPLLRPTRTRRRNRATSGIVVVVVVLGVVCAFHAREQQRSVLAALRQSSTTLAATADGEAAAAAAAVSSRGSQQPERGRRRQKEEEEEEEENEHGNGEVGSTSYPTTDTLHVGVLSRKPFEFFQKIRDDIDGEDHAERCQRYGFAYRNLTKPRRIFYGALLTNEPWEVLEIVGAEAHSIFSGMVLVEGNRTQTFEARNASRLRHGPLVAKIFGVPSRQVQVRLFVNEDPDRYRHDADPKLSREHAQRQSIVRGWKELGMRPTDLGYLADTDETFSRDFFRALQYCDDIRELDYEAGQCRHTQNGVKSRTLVFEGSPECPTDKRAWYHPDIFWGHCIEGIGNETLHPMAPRAREGSVDRAPGWGDPQIGRTDPNRTTIDRWSHEHNVTEGRYPLYSAADMRRIGGSVLTGRKQKGHTRYSGYHLHNFFAHATSIRLKYRTYAHNLGITGYAKSLASFHPDLALMVGCVAPNGSNLTVETPAISGSGNRTGPTTWKSVPGGMVGLLPPYPIYFHDETYRSERHRFVRSLVVADEQEYRRYHNLPDLPTDLPLPPSPTLAPASTT